MASHRVKNLEVCRVAPFSNSSESAAEFSLPLTFFDLFWFKFPPVERIFFYELTESTPGFFNSVMLPKLKRSLSLTLLHFLPLAGKVTWPPNSPQPIILYIPDDTVSLTVAESNADFHHISSNKIFDAVELHPYLPELSISNISASVAAFQITLFPNQGFSIGCTTNHAVLDGRSITMFMKSWAHICKTLETEKQSQLLPELVPVFDRTIINDPCDLGTLFMTQWAELTEPQSRINQRNFKVLSQIRDAANTVRLRSTFELTREEIIKLKMKVQSQTKNPLQLSTFIVTCAYVLACMVKTREGDDNRKVIFIFPVDCRTRLVPPLPMNYFGNCICGHEITGVAKEFKDENAIAIAAERLSYIIKGLGKGLLNGIEGKLSRIKDLKQGVQVISVAGSTRFDIYGTDFGWGRPRKVQIPSIDRTGAIALAESRNGNGGVEIGMALPRHEMEVFASLFANGLKDGL